MLGFILGVAVAGSPCLKPVTPPRKHHKHKQHFTVPLQSCVEVTPLPPALVTLPPPVVDAPIHISTPIDIPVPAQPGYASPVYLPPDTAWTPFPPYDGFSGDVSIVGGFVATRTLYVNVSSPKAYNDYKYYTTNNTYNSKTTNNYIDTTYNYSTVNNNTVNNNGGGSGVKAPEMQFSAGASLPLLLLTVGLLVAYGRKR